MSFRRQPTHQSAILRAKASQTRLLFSLLETLEAQDAAVPEDRSLSKADAELIGNLLKGFADE